MNRSYTLTLVITLVLVGSAFLMFAQLPDRAALVSTDGDFRFRGSVADVNLRVETKLGTSSTARVSPIYRVFPDTLLAGEGFVSLRSNEDLVQHSLARYSEEKVAWEFLPTEHVRGEFLANTSRAGRFALLKSRDVEIPSNYRDLISRLISQSPREAEAARFQYIYALVENDYVLVPGTTLQDGCGGQFKASTADVSMGFVREAATVVVDGVELEGWHGVVAEWLLGNGCEGDGFELVD